MTKYILSAAMAFSLIVGASSRAAEKVELKRVHMCCEGCAKEVGRVLEKVEGVTGVAADQDTASARFTAPDVATAQKAIDALAAAGFHGELEKSRDLSFKNDSGATAGKVKALTVTGFHNSCGGCVRSFREAIKDVPGVTKATLKSKVSFAEITGDFDAAELVRALNAAGFHVKVKN